MSDATGLLARLATNTRRAHDPRRVPGETLRFEVSPEALDALLVHLARVAALGPTAGIPVAVMSTDADSAEVKAFGIPVTANPDLFADQVRLVRTIEI